MLVPYYYVFLQTLVGSTGLALINWYIAHGFWLVPFLFAWMVYVSYGARSLRRAIDLKERLLRKVSQPPRGVDDAERLFHELWPEFAAGVSSFKWMPACHHLWCQRCQADKLADMVGFNPKGIFEFFVHPNMRILRQRFIKV